MKTKPQRLVRAGNTGRLRRLFSSVLLLFTVCAIPGPRARAGESVIQDAQGMDCHVYTPDPVDPKKTYQLLVGVHGAGGAGKGAAGLQEWARRGDVIVIGPSFQSKGERPYQNGDGVHAEKLITLFKKLKSEYPLRDKMFLHGFSGGSQFVHRFAMNHPEFVCGVSAHSGGSWATDGFGQINPKAKHIPFAISCGEKDTGSAFPGAKFNRLAWLQRFRDELEAGKFCFVAATWPGVGHGASPGMWKLMKECFQLATGLPGASATETVPISADWKNLDRLPKPDGPGVSRPAPPGVSRANPFLHATVFKDAFARADRETIPDESLVNFMRKYPPALWKGESGSTRLLEQCQGAAARWRQTATSAGRFDGAVRREFERFAQGLELPD